MHHTFLEWIHTPSSGCTWKGSKSVHGAWVRVLEAGDEQQACDWWRAGHMTTILSSDWSRWWAACRAPTRSWGRGWPSSPPGRSISTSQNIISSRRRVAPTPTRTIHNKHKCRQGSHTLLGCHLHAAEHRYAKEANTAWYRYIHSVGRSCVSYLHVTSYISCYRSREVMPGKLSDDGYLSDKNWALNEERYKHAYIDINFANCIV